MSSLEITLQFWDVVMDLVPRGHRPLYPLSRDVY